MSKVLECPAATGKQLSAKWENVLPVQHKGFISNVDEIKAVATTMVRSQNHPLWSPKAPVYAHAEMKHFLHSTVKEMAGFMAQIKESGFDVSLFMIVVI